MSNEVSCPQTANSTVLRTQWLCHRTTISLLLHCVSKKGPTLKRYSSKLYGSILMIFGGNVQKSLE